MTSDKTMSLTRRDALGMLGATVAAGSLAVPAMTMAQNATRSSGPAAAAQSDEYLLRGGHVLTLDATLGELSRGDVHIRRGAIMAVAERIDAPTATLIDATGMIVMPGFVETHWHMWNSIWRGMADDATDYFRLQSLSAHYTTQDHYTSVLYAAMEAINAGFTTCHNWAHGVRSFADVEAEMRALVDAGVRARMGYVGVTAAGPTSAEDLRRALGWIETNGQGRLSLSMLLDGARDHFVRQVQLARELKLKTITDHGGFLAYPDQLGPEFLYTHGTNLTAEQIALIARRGVKVGLCPGTDPMIGAGLPPIHPLLAGGVPLENISFTVDVTAQTPADPFEMLRTLVNAGRIQQIGNTSLYAITQANPEWRFSYRDALRLGTLSGANVLGIADQVGSLTPGKRADVIAIRTDDINMLPAPNTDPAMQLIQHAQPANVDTVFIDGQLRKQAGKLVGIDVRKIVADAAAAQAALRVRAGQR
jgi:5-methylthioadenosine/S-adenosylhomocysteine deaminase